MLTLPLFIYFVINTIAVRVSRLHACFCLTFSWVYSFNWSIFFCLLYPGASCVFFCTVWWCGLPSCPAGGHCVKQTEFVTQEQERKKLDNRKTLWFHPPLSRCQPSSSPLLQLLQLCFAALSQQSQLPFLLLLFFNIFILSSLHPALKKNNITKFPNVYSRVRNSSSSSPVVVDVSQTWQASLFYLILSDCPHTSGFSFRVFSLPITECFKTDNKTGLQ